MATVFSDRVKESTTTTGTGSLTLSGAISGYLPFSSAMSVSDTCYYCIDDGMGNWEIGLGTLSAIDTLARTTVHSSSNSNAAVNFSAGTKSVYITLSAAAFSGMITDLSASTSLPANLVYEYEVTGSAVTTIPVTGLDLNADGGDWELWLEYVSNTTVNSSIACYVNGDTTATNYTFRYIQSSGTSATTNVVNSNQISLIYGAVGIGGIGFSTTRLSIVNSHVMMHTEDLQSNITYGQIYFNYKSTADTNITTLDLTCSSTSGLGVGTKVKLFKKRW